MVVARPHKRLADWQPLTLPYFGLLQARRETWLSQRRLPVGLRLAGAVWEVAPVAVEPLRDTKDWTRITVQTALGELRLFMPPGALAAWIQDRYPGTVLADLDPGLAPLLIEDAAVDALHRLEVEGLGPLRVAAVTPNVPLGLTAVTAFRVARGGGPDFTIALETTVALRERIDAFITAQPLAPLARPTLRVPLTFLAGATALTWSELYRLRVGDAILLRASMLAHEKVACLAGEALAQTCSVQGATFILDGPLMPLSSFPGRHPISVLLGEGKPADPLAFEDGWSENVPVQVRFELGRSEETVGDLASFAAGRTIQLGPRPAMLVDILTSGIRIGTGSLMPVPDGVGIRINQLSR